MAQPYKTCPRCRQPSQIHASQCWQCGHTFRTLPPDQRTQYHMPGQPINFRTDPRFNGQPNMTLILTMWVLTALCFSYGLSAGSLPLLMLIDAPALIIAFCLAGSRNHTDRTNGYLKLGLEVLGFLAGFALGFGKAFH